MDKKAKLLKRADMANIVHTWGPGSCNFVLLFVVPRAKFGFLLVRWRGQVRSGQIAASSNKVTLNSSYFREYERGINSRLGTRIFCTDRVG